MINENYFLDRHYRGGILYLKNGLNYLLDEEACCLLFRLQKQETLCSEDSSYLQFFVEIGILSKSKIQNLKF